MKKDYNKYFNEVGIEHIVGGQNGDLVPLKNIPTVTFGEIPTTGLLVMDNETRPCSIDTVNLKSDYFSYEVEARLTLLNRKVNLIKKVIFNDPATIVYWWDGSKTVVKQQKCDKKKKFDPEKGLAMAIAKKFFGNKGSYYNELRKWTKTYDPKKKKGKEKKEK